MPLLLDLVENHGRPISVLHKAAALILECENPKSPETVLGDLQWDVSYPGVLYSASVCQVTGELLSPSHEWRRSARLLVRSSSIDASQPFALCTNCK